MLSSNILFDRLFPHDIISIRSENNRIKNCFYAIYTAIFLTSIIMQELIILPSPSIVTEAYYFK